MSFVEYIERQLGRNWVVFPRRTQRLVARYGDDVVVISQKQYDEIRACYAREVAGK